MATGVSILVILLVTTVNMMPADVDTFTMTTPDEEAKNVRLTKQADGGWKVVEPADEEMGTFYVKGTKITIKSKDGEDEEFSQDLAEMLGVDEKTDWKKLTEIKTDVLTIKIKRQKNGIDFVIKTGEGDESEQVLKARWDEKDAMIRKDLYDLFTVYEKGFQYSWNRTISKGFDRFAEELQGLVGGHELEQEAGEDRVYWKDKTGRIEAMFAFVIDPTDLDGILGVYQEIKQKHIPLTFVVIEQLADGEGNFDIFRLSKTSYLEHNNRAWPEGRSPD